MKLGRIDEETTANISYFKGGQKAATNIVTDYVEIEGEVRSLQKKKLDQIVRHIKNQFITTANSYDARAEFVLDEIYPGFSIDQQDEVVKIAKRSAQNLSLSSDLLKSGGGSDANIFNSFGIPTANLSVGYEHIHTTDERIHEDQLVQLAQLTVEIVNQSFIK